ncbi:MAG: histidine phosphatase family protein [Alphaproteobacteria bacterium]|nr:MAG: histidine phosphatase family protein [Alphaproteobacteria bacterium]
MNTKETQEAAFVDAQHRLVAELPDSFFYLRHGKTTDNQAEIISGGERDHESILLPESIEEASRLGATIENMREYIALICHSPMIRARDTARYINATANIPMIEIQKLHEWKVGNCSGRKNQEFSGPLSNWEYDPDGGESRTVFATRVAEGMEECCRSLNPYRARTADKPRSMLVVAHAGVWWALRELLGLERDQIHNCVPIQVERVPNQTNNKDGLPRWQHRALSL